MMYKVYKVYKAYKLCEMFKVYKVYKMFKLSKVYKVLPPPPQPQTSYPTLVWLIGRIPSQIVLAGTDCPSNDPSWSMIVPQRSFYTDLNHISQHEKLETLEDELFARHLNASGVPSAGLWVLFLRHEYPLT